MCEYRREDTGPRSSRGDITNLTCPPQRVLTKQPAAVQIGGYFSTVASLTDYRT